MKPVKLKHPYITIKKEQQYSFGGSQTWCSSRVMQKYGCGVIAGTDVLLYISLHKDFCGEIDSSKEVYLKLLQKMRTCYFPVIPGLGMPWWVLVGGLNLYFYKNKLPFKASVGVLTRNLTQRIHAMLVQDLPVILAIGPNFPIPWKKHKLPLYEKRGQDYIEVCHTVAHFVVITGMDDKWLEISSWGSKYYVNIKEYKRYVRKHSCLLVSNIIQIHSTHKKQLSVKEGLTKRKTVL